MAEAENVEKHEMEGRIIASDLEQLQFASVKVLPPIELSGEFFPEETDSDHRMLVRISSLKERLEKAVVEVTHKEGTSSIQQQQQQVSKRAVGMYKAEGNHFLSKGRRFEYAVDGEKEDGADQRGEQ